MAVCLSLPRFTYVYPRAGEDAIPTNADIANSIDTSHQGSFSSHRHILSTPNLSDEGTITTHADITLGDNFNLAASSHLGLTAPGGVTLAIEDTIPAQGSIATQVNIATGCQVEISSRNPIEIDISPISNQRHIIEFGITLVEVNIPMFDDEDVIARVDISWEIQIAINNSDDGRISASTCWGEFTIPIGGILNRFQFEIVNDGRTVNRKILAQDIAIGRNSNSLAAGGNIAVLTGIGIEISPWSDGNGIIYQDKFTAGILRGLPLASRLRARVTFPLRLRPLPA